MTHSSQESGRIPESSTKLKKQLYSGNIMSDVLLIYSFIILSLEHALLFFKDFIHFKISASLYVRLKFHYFHLRKNASLPLIDHHWCLFVHLNF